MLSSSYQVFTSAEPLLIKSSQVNAPKIWYKCIKIVMHLHYFGPTMMDSHKTLNRLSQRQRVVAQYYAHGLNYKAIAEHLHIAPVTVRNHIASIYRKLKIHDKAELATLIANTTHAPDSIHTETAHYPVADDRLNAWLESLALGQYIPLFAAHAVDWETLLVLDEQALYTMGITELDDRKRLLKALAEFAPEQPNTEIDLASERRRLTVLLCRLNTVTAQTKASDLETVQEQFGLYKDSCQQIVNRYDGYIAHIIDTTLHIYFGYPKAHENDAERAVRAGLELLAAFTDTCALQDAKLALRIAVTTGPVIVGETTGKSGINATEAIGEAPSLAEALLYHAASGSVLIDAETRHLLGAFFEYRALAPLSEYGANQLSVWQVLGELPTESRFAARHGVALIPLVGRDEELALLQRYWHQAKTGEGQLVLISGEPGIGKSRIAWALSETLAAEAHYRISYQCSPYHCDSALYPVIQRLIKAAAFTGADSVETKLDKLEVLLGLACPEPRAAAALLAPLLGLDGEGRYGKPSLSPQQQRKQTLQTLVEQLTSLAQRQPLLVVLEDAHWIDPSTLELIELSLEAISQARVLWLLTARPSFEHAFGGHPIVNHIALNRLGRESVRAMITRLSRGKPLPEELREAIIGKADGVPLFVEELTKMVITADFLRDAGERYELTEPLSAVAIPATLQDSLMARLDHLPGMREVAQIGAVFGREFSYEMLQAVAPFEEPILRDSLARLVEAELLYQRGQPPQAHYIFKHALIQDRAYQALLIRTRQQYHQRVAALLENRFPELVETEPELLAHHYTEAGLSIKAVPYWLKAGQQAGMRSAYTEATSYLRTGLDLVQAQPDYPEHSQQEILLLTAFGAVLIATKGHASSGSEQLYSRARELCEKLGETTHLFPVLFGLWRINQARARFRKALDLSEQLLAVAQQHQKKDSEHLMAHYALGLVLLHLGKLAPARLHLEQGLILYDIQQHPAELIRIYAANPKVQLLAFEARTLCLLGYPDKALEQMKASLSLAEELSHPLSRAFVGYHSSVLSTHLGAICTARKQAKAAMAIAEAQGFPGWAALPKVVFGWAAALRGQGDEGIAQMRQGLADSRNLGIISSDSFFLALLTEGYEKNGCIELGLAAVKEALTDIANTDGRFIEAELHRLTGKLLLMQHDPDSAAETCFQQALAVARDQDAKWWELRAATSLAHLWRQQGKRQQAYDLLAPVYNWFTEGFDTVDLKNAKSLLDELA